MTHHDSEKSDSPSYGGQSDAPLQAQTPPDTARTIGGWMIALIWLIVIAGGTMVAQGWLDRRDASRQNIVIDERSGREGLVIRADRFGQYLVRGVINNEDVLFLLDTGASGISVPGSIADKIGLRRGRPFSVITANGTTTVYDTRLNTLNLGPFTQTDVRAHVNPSMDGPVVLLGMSFLRNFELIQRSETLTLSY